MSAPQLTDPSISSEWIRTVAEGTTADKPRNPSQTSIADGAVAPRRRRFVRLVTYTMLGLVAFTFLGVASFVWRQHAMQSALAEPPPRALVAPTPPAPADAAPTPAAPTAAPEAPAAVAPTPTSATPKPAALHATKKTVLKRAPAPSPKLAIKPVKR